MRLSAFMSFFVVTKVYTINFQIWLSTEQLLECKKNVTLIISKTLNLDLFHTFSACVSFQERKSIPISFFSDFCLRPTPLQKF